MSWNDLTVAELRIFLTQHRNVACPTALYRLKADYVDLCEQSFTGADLQEALVLFGKESLLPVREMYASRLYFQNFCHMFQIVTQKTPSHADPGSNGDVGGSKRRTPLKENLVRTAGRFSLPSEDIRDSPSARRAPHRSARSRRLDNDDQIGPGNSNQAGHPGFIPAGKVIQPSIGREQLNGFRKGLSTEDDGPVDQIRIKEEVVSSDEALTPSRSLPQVSNHSQRGLEDRFSLESPRSSGTNFGYDSNRSPSAFLPALDPQGNPVEWRIRDPHVIELPKNKEKQRVRSKDTRRTSRRTQASARSAKSMRTELSPNMGRSGATEKRAPCADHRNSSIKHSMRSHEQNVPATPKAVGEKNLKKPPTKAEIVRVRWGRVAIAIVLLSFLVHQLVLLPLWPIISNLWTLQKPGEFFGSLPSDAQLPKRSLFNAVYSAGNLLYERYLKQLPYCDSVSPDVIMDAIAQKVPEENIVEENVLVDKGTTPLFNMTVSHRFNPAKLETFNLLGTTDCIPCPLNADCRNGAMSCRYPQYVKQRQGRNNVICIRNTEAYRAANALGTRIGDFLGIVRGDAVCNWRPKDDRTARFGVDILEPHTGEIIRGCSQCQLEFLVDRLQRSSSRIFGDKFVKDIFFEQLTASISGSNVLRKQLGVQMMAVPFDKLRTWQDSKQGELFPSSSGRSHEGQPTENESSSWNRVMKRGLMAYSTDEAYIPSTLVGGMDRKSQLCVLAGAIPQNSNVIKHILPDSGAKPNVVVFYADIQKARLSLFCKATRFTKRWAPWVAVIMGLYYFARRCVRQRWRQKQLAQAVETIISDNTQIRPMAPSAIDKIRKAYAIGPRIADIRLILVASGGSDALTAVPDRAKHHGIVRTVLGLFYRVLLPRLLRCLWYVLVEQWVGTARLTKVFLFMDKLTCGLLSTIGLVNGRRSRKHRKPSLNGYLGAPSANLNASGRVLHRLYPEYAWLANECSDLEIARMCDHLCRERPDEFCKSVLYDDTVPFYFSMPTVKEIERKLCAAAGTAERSTVSDICVLWGDANNSATTSDLTTTMETD